MLSITKSRYAGKKLFSLFLMMMFAASLLNAQDESELKQKIKMMNDEFANAMVSGDRGPVWQYYSEDVISMPSYEPMLRGIDACKQSSEKMKESGMKMTAFKLATTDLIQSGNLVIDIGTYDLTMTIPQMGEMPYNDHGKYMTVWETQDDGSLKIKAETWNSDINPWMEMQKMGERMEGHEGHMEMEDKEDDN